ncbi:MAG: hypothetical protein GY745_16120 [Actinomycetia bacterium]|nr:hypothetical protein [Actinomycetes bacterium]
MGEVEEVSYPSLEPIGELPFYEACFSNYIEGTVFTLDEAREIIESQQPPADRPEDGQDILGTYRCVVDPVGRATSSDDPDGLIAYLRARHQTILAGRPDQEPGEWKTKPNLVGTYQFVDPDLVEGTLRKGLAEMDRLPPGFARALYVPNVFRNEYVSALRRVSTTSGDVRGFVTVMVHAWRWTAAMPWADQAATEGQPEATNALLGSTHAQTSGLRLTVPSGAARVGEPPLVLEVSRV